jgi:hypothetical protein
VQNDTYHNILDIMHHIPVLKLINQDLELLMQNTEGSFIDVLLGCFLHQAAYVSDV